MGQRNHPTGKKMTGDDYRALCALFLEHHLDPITVGSNRDLKALDENLEFCLARGLMYFQTPSCTKLEEFQPYYKHLNEKGWLAKALVYSARDEPTEDQFRTLVVPNTAMIHKEFPGLRVFLATQYHPGLDQAWTCG